MTKTKKKQPAPTARDPKSLPLSPPSDLSEAVLWGAFSEITEDVERDYVALIYNRNPTAEVRKKGTRAVLLMATVGFAFLNWQRGRAENAARAEARK